MTPTNKKQLRSKEKEAISKLEIPRKICAEGVEDVHHLDNTAPKLPCGLPAQECKEKLECCSQDGICGSTTGHCLDSLRCQQESGSYCKDREIVDNLVAGQKVVSEEKPYPVSVNGKCGGKKSQQQCMFSKFGNCCSQYGFCGSSVRDCSLTFGCQDEFGWCFGDDGGE